MKKNYYRLFGILFLFYSCHILAQQEVLDGSVKSPQLADMIRYGNTPVSMYSGRLDLQIPLTSIEDRDFSFPISLRYNSSGFMPMKNDGLVGLNWSIACGGAIIREVKGIPDDKPNDLYIAPDVTEYGFLYFLKNKNKLKHEDVVKNPGQYMTAFELYPSTNDYARMKSSVIDNSLNNGNDIIESCSDIYHFNFGQHSGKFTIKFDGSVNVISNDGRKYDVDLSGYNYATFDGKNAPSKFVITTDDGYKYIFGGTYDAMEYSFQWQHSTPAGYNEWDGFKRLMHDYFYVNISSFNLSQIIAPSGRTLSIIYKKLPADFYTVNGDKMYRTLTSKDAAKYGDFFSTSYTSSYSHSYSDKPNYPNLELWGINHSLTKLALIDFIETDRDRINFSYKKDSDRKMPLNKSTGLTTEVLMPIEIAAGAKLNSIWHSLKINNSKSSNLNYRTIKLDYSSWKSHSPSSERLLLEKVNISDQGIYSMQYNMDRSAPMLTYNVDHWNYWISNKEISNRGSTSSLRDADESPGSANYGMLTKISYPTGGFSEFEYERHDYSTEIQRNLSTAYFPKPVDVGSTLIAGGSRIKEIRESNGSAKRYLYTTGLNNNISSGILTYRPIYYRTAYFTAPAIFGYTNQYAPSKWKYFKCSNVGFNTKTYEQDHVVYSNVIEKEIKPVEIASVQHLEYFGHRKAVEKVFTMPAKDSEEVTIRINFRLDPNCTAKIYFYDKYTGSVIKKKEFTNQDQPPHRGFIYRLRDLDLRPGTQYKVVIDGCGLSVVDVWLEYPKEGQNLDYYQIANEFYSPKDHIDMSFPENIYNTVLGISYPSNILHINMDMLDRSNLRGQLKSRTYYKTYYEAYNHKRRRLVKKTLFNYYNYAGATDNSKLSVYFKKIVLAEAFIDEPRTLHAGPIRYFSTYYTPVFQMVPVRPIYNKLVSKKTVEYIYDGEGSKFDEYNPWPDIEGDYKIPSDSLIQEEKYSYKAPYYYIDNNSLIGSDGKKYTTTYEYAYEKNTPQYNNLKKKHILNPVTEIRKAVNGVSVSVLKNSHSMKSNRLVIDSIQEGRNKDILRTKFVVKDFDNNGNPYKVLIGANRELQYIWDSQSFLIGKIENPSQIKKIDHSSMDYTRLINPEAFITSYTHKSAIGLSSIVDIRGIPIYYDYNEKTNRLERVSSVIDGNKYIYNYYKVKLNNE